MKKYSVIYADPPWNISKSTWKKWKGSITDKYSLMKTEDILKIPIADFCDKDCSLFLWTTHTFLQEALNVMKAWGFKYHCVITWYKVGGFSLEGFHRNTELCLFGYKGKMNVNKRGKFIPLLITEPKTKHSKKPNMMRTLIESNIVSKKRLELFAREKTEGWDVWGNELPNDISLKAQ